MRLWRCVPVPSRGGLRSGPLLFFPGLHRSLRAQKVALHYQGDRGSLPPVVRVPSSKQRVQKFRLLLNEQLHPPKSRGQVQESPTRANSSGKAPPQACQRCPSRDRTKQECNARPPQMDLFLTQVHWSGSFRFQHAKALCPLAGVLRRKREKAAPAFALDEVQQCDPSLWSIVHSRVTTRRSL